MCLQLSSLIKVEGGILVTEEDNQPIHIVERFHANNVSVTTFEVENDTST